MIVEGMRLPDGAAHFAAQLAGGPLFHGRGTYKTPKLMAALEACGSRRGHAVDVGAHVGLWSWPLSFEFGRVTAFEPVAEFAECWRANLEGRPNAELCRQALGATAGGATFTHVTDGEGTIEWTAGGTWSAMARLDDFEIGPLDFLKISCDGCELPVIQGGEHTIRRDRPVILVQQKRKRSDVYGHPRDGALDLLRSWGAALAWSMKGDHCLKWPA